MYRIVGLYREQREHTKKLINKRAVCAKSSKIRRIVMGEWAVKWMAFGILSGETVQEIFRGGCRHRVGDFTMDEPDLIQWTMPALSMVLECEFVV